MSVDAKILLRGGLQGLIVLRDQSLLYVAAEHNPEQASALVDIALRTDAVSMFEQVCAHIVAADFQVPPLTLIAWYDVPELLVFGDLDVTTTAPSVPSVNASALSTWIEHRFRGLHEVTIAVGTEPVLSATDFRSGVVPAAGFELRVGPTSTTAPTAPAEVETPVEAEVSVNATVVESRDPTPEPAVEAPADIDSAPDQDEPDPTTMNPNPNPFDDASNGSLPLGDSASSAGFGFLEIGGERVEVQDQLLLGRKPSKGQGPAAEVPGDMVSKSHARIAVDGGSIYVHDLGSTNGTFVVPSMGTDPKRILPDMPHLLLPGDVIQLGQTKIRYDAP